jgi:hypothetical protein
MEESVEAKVLKGATVIAADGRAPINNVGVCQVECVNGLPYLGLPPRPSIT